MHGSAISRTAARLAGRVTGAVVLTGVLMASGSGSTPAALAATSHHGASRVTCHQRQHAHCARAGAKRGGHRARSAASGLLVWSWSAPHASAASVPLGTAAAAPGSATTASSGSSTPGSTSAPCVNADLAPTSDNLSLIDAATLCLINQQRVLHHEHPLRDNADLDRSALHHSQDMVAADYYDHVSPTGETPLARIQASGYVPRADDYELSENIDLGILTSATPAAVVTAWMNSPDHRANILNGDFVDSGIGVVAQIPAQYASGDPAATYTQDFGAVWTPAGVVS